MIPFIQSQRENIFTKIKDFLFSQHLFAKISLLIMLLAVIITPIAITHRQNLGSHAANSIFNNCIQIPQGMDQSTINSLSQSGKVNWCNSQQSNNNSGVLTISLNPSLTSLAIQSPLGGTNTLSCTNNTTDTSWFISQWNNEQDLCNGSTQVDQNYCSGASFSRANGAGRICYWNTNQQIQLALNTGSMQNNGCAIYNDPGWKDGGYSLYLSNDISKRSDYNTTYPNLGELQSLTLSTGFDNHYFQGGSCPANTDTSKFPNTTTPITTDYLGIVISDPINSHTFFYQATFYDNRYTGGPMYSSCNGSQAVYGDMVSAFGQPIATPGSGNHQYSFNVLPQVEKYITQCFGNTPNFNLSNYKLGDMYIGSENLNNTVTSIIITNPNIQLAYTKPDSQPIGYLDSVSTSSFNGWTCQDYSGDYSGSNRVDFYADGTYGQGGRYMGSVTANSGGEAAIGNQCGGTTSHRFSFDPHSLTGGNLNVLSDGKSHQIYAFGIDRDTGRNANTLLIGAPMTMAAGIPPTTTSTIPTSVPTSIPTPHQLPATSNSILPMTSTVPIFITQNPTGITVLENSPSPVPGKIARDIASEHVTLEDFNLFLSCYGTKADTPSCLSKKDADINGDGIVDGADYNILMRAFIKQGGL